MKNNLAGLNFLVTRPLPQGLELCEQIKSLGGHAIHFPTIEFTSQVDKPKFQQALMQLGDQDWLIFISPQAVYESVAAIRRQWPQFPAKVKFAAVGKGTAQALKQAGYIVDACPETDWNSEGLLALPDFQSINGKKIAIIRGEGGRELLEQSLQERGVTLLSVIAYKRVLPKADNQNLNLIKQHKIDVIICTSFEAVKNLKLLLDEQAWLLIKDKHLIVPSERVKILAQELDFETIWVARNAGHEAIIDVILKIN